jgi:hypothetical protein
VLGLRVLELRVRETAQALHEEHHGRDPGARDLGRVVERPAWKPVRSAGDLAHRLVRELDELRVEEDRLDAPDLLPLDLDVLLGGEAPARLLGFGQHAGQLRRVQVPLIEEDGAGLDDGGDDSGPRHAAPHRAHGSLAGALGDLPDLERELCGCGQGVAALVHGRRAGVRSLAAEGDLVPFHSEGAEDDAKGEVQRLEHGPLLYVELEVGGRPLELSAGVQCVVEVDSLPRERVRERIAVGIAACPELLLVGHRARCRARAEEAPAEPGAFLVRPVHEAHRQRWVALLGDAAQDLNSGDDVERAVEPPAVGDRVDVAPDQKGAVRGSGQGEPLVSGLVRLLLDAERIQLPGEPFACADPGIRPRHALGAFFVAGELPKLCQLFDSAAGGERHGGQLYKLPGLMGRGSRPLRRWRNDRQRKKKERDRRRATEKKAK